jgi:hypothetical protein
MPVDLSKQVMHTLALIRNRHRPYAARQESLPKSAVSRVRRNMRHVLGNNQARTTLAGPVAGHKQALRDHPAWHIEPVARIWPCVEAHIHICFGSLAVLAPVGP